MDGHTEFRASDYLNSETWGWKLDSLSYSQFNELSQAVVNYATTNSLTAFFKAKAVIDAHQGILACSSEQLPAANINLYYLMILAVRAADVPDFVLLDKLQHLAGKCKDGQSHASKDDVLRVKLEIVQKVRDGMNIFGRTAPPKPASRPAKSFVSLLGLKPALIAARG